jgi:RimJ/RimL family protein N-acetyltransferase
MENTDKLTKLRPIQDSDYRFLFTLLKERDPKANISHKKMPSYTEHLEFVKSKPYSKWYIIEYNNKKAGSIYLSKNNEIGIFIKKNLQGKHIGRTVLQQLIDKNPRNRYLANVSPQNSKSMEFFKKNSFKLIQHTFELKL